MEIFGKDLLKKLRDAELEGENAHAIYSPPYRPKLSQEEILAKNPKLAAVNILLYLKNDEWFFPLIVRTTNERDRHSGQISLPGGKKEESDENFIAAAKRETAEEVGIEEHYIRIIREMSPIYIPPSNFLVQPFISYTRKNPAFKIQKSEVAELIEFPVASILSLPDTPVLRTLPDSKNTAVPVMDFDGKPVWGATSMILSEFRQLLKKV